MFLRIPKFVGLFLLYAVAMTAHAEIPTLSGDIGAHDPSSLIKYSNTYRTWFTSDGLYNRQSTDLRNWTTGAPVFPVGTWPSWINTYVTNFGGFFWAPECFKITNTYYLYYSCSMGARESAIGVATSTNLSNWTDQGMVIYSDNVVTYGSIDPGVFWDATGNLWMVFGSHLNGIFLVQLDPATGKRLNTTVYNIANLGDAEAGYVKYNNGYYYLFYNRGICCAGVDSTYNIRMGRSASVTGPYVDRNGVAVGTSGGSYFQFSTGRVLGPGHVGLLDDNGTNWLTYHYYDANANGGATLGLTRFAWGADGWPAVTNDWSAFYTFDVDATDHRGVYSGTLQNGASIVTDAERGKVLQLDGTTNYVRLPNAVANASTFMTWVKWNGGNNWQRIFDFGVDTTNYLFLTPQAFGGKLRFAIKNGGAEQLMDAPAALPTNQWVHVAVTVDGSRGVLYQNGLPVATNSAMTILPWQLLCRSNYIGESRFTNDPSFSGKIDSFRVFGRALSAAEILEMAEANPSLAHRYSFTTDARDSIGMAHGALMGNAVVTNAALKLTGASGGHAELPHGFGGLASKCSAVTFEFWATFGVNANWARAFDFGASSGGFGSQYVFFSPHTSFGSQRFEIATGAGVFTRDPTPTLDNRSVHVVCILDPTNNYAAIYTNGVLEVTATATIPALSSVSADYAYLGRSLFSADGWLNGTIDEFRIYDGRLTPAQITANLNAGPNQVLPSVPTGLAATSGTSQVVLSWSSAPGATNYNVKRATVSGGPYTTIGSSSTTSYADMTAVGGTTYYYVVSAVNAAGESVNSIQVSATPVPPIPPAPTGLVATFGDAQAVLNWTASSGATSYRVKRSFVSGGPYTVIATNLTTSYTNIGLANGTAYYYVVSAVNTAGESANSAQVSANPTWSTPPNIAEWIYALTTDNQLIAFGSTTPGNILAAYTVSGLQANEKIVGLDFWNGTLYGLGDLNNLYTINRANGAAGLIGSFNPTMNGEAFGFDAEPGGLRLVSNLDQNLLLAYGDGAATVGATLNGSPNPAVTGLAYHPGNGQRYVADYFQNTIGILNPATGLMSTITPAGIDFSRHNGFDISSNPGNTAYLASPASSSGPAANLYKVDLTTGSATLVGLVGLVGDDTLIRSLAVGSGYVELTPTNLTFSANGDLLTLSWPADHIGWRLETQTNSLAIGFGTNWFEVTDSTTTNSVLLPIDMQNGTVFYRLIYP